MIFSSYYWNFWVFWILLWALSLLISDRSSSFSLHTIFSSLFSFDTVFADNLRFYWAVLTSSPRSWFSLKSFCILCLYVSDSRSLASILALYSLSYLLSLAWVLADNLRFSWASRTSSPRETFSPVIFWIFILSMLFSWLFSSIRALYSLSSRASFWFWLADNRKLYWAETN